MLVSYAISKAENYCSIGNRFGVFSFPEWKLQPGFTLSLTGLNRSPVVHGAAQVAASLSGSFPRGGRGRQPWLLHSSGCRKPCLQEWAVNKSQTLTPTD